MRKYGPFSHSCMTFSYLKGCWRCRSSRSSRATDQLSVDDSWGAGCHWGGHSLAFGHLIIYNTAVRCPVIIIFFDHFYVSGGYLLRACWRWGRCNIVIACWDPMEISWIGIICTNFYKGHFTIANSTSKTSFPTPCTIWSDAHLPNNC